MQIKRYNLQMPIDLHAQLKVEAKLEGRSLCKQIIFLLQWARDNKKAVDQFGDVPTALHNNNRQGDDFYE